MKTIDLSFDESRFVKNPQNAQLFSEGGHIEFFELLLTQGIANKFPNGQIPISKGKVLARIQLKLDALKPSDGKEENPKLEVEEAEFDLIKSLFLDENTTFHVTQHQLVSIFAEAVEEAQKGA